MSMLNQAKWSQHCGQLVNTKAYFKYTESNRERQNERGAVLVPAMEKVAKMKNPSMDALFAVLSGRDELIEALKAADKEIKSR